MKVAVCGFGAMNCYMRVDLSPRMNSQTENIENWLVTPQGFSKTWTTTSRLLRESRMLATLQSPFESQTASICLELSWIQLNT